MLTVLNIWLIIVLTGLVGVVMQEKTSNTLACAVIYTVTLAALMYNLHMM